MGNLFSSQPTRVPSRPVPRQVVPYSPSGNNPYNQEESDDCKKAINDWQSKNSNAQPKWMNDGTYCYVISAGDGAGYKTLDECTKGSAQCDPNSDCQNGISSKCNVKLQPIAESYDQPCCRTGPYVGLNKTWGNQNNYTL